MPEPAYSDPAGMPEDERMTPAELRVVREFLGFSVPALAAHLEVSERTVRHWEEGRYQIPDGTRLEIERIEVETDDYVEAVVEALSAAQTPDGALAVSVYPTDEDYRAVDPTSPYPASWHRSVIARATLEVPGVAILYGDGKPHVRRVRLPRLRPPMVVLVAFGETRGVAGETLAGLTAAGFSVQAASWDRPLKGQMVQADRSGAAFAVVIGPQEAADGRVQVRDLTAATQEPVAVDALSEYLAAR